MLFPPFVHLIGCKFGDNLSTVMRRFEVTEGTYCLLFYSIVFPEAALQKCL